MHPLHRVVSKRVCINSHSQKYLYLHIGTIPPRMRTLIGKRSPAPHACSDGRGRKSFAAQHIKLTREVLQ